MLEQLNVFIAEFTFWWFLGLHRHQDLTYRMTPGDEVEDMSILLTEVRRQIPSITAVSSGAIASDYQRTRVENVCSRLGLVSLAYLWKQDQSLLLQEMVFYFFNTNNMQLDSGLVLYHMMVPFICFPFLFWCQLGNQWNCGYHSKGKQYIKLIVLFSTFYFILIFRFLIQFFFCVLLIWV